MRGRHRAKPRRLYWWQRRRAFTYQLQAWQLQLQEAIQDARDIVAEIREKNNAGK